MSDKARRNQPLLPMGIVTQLTELSARQIRYYEQQGLIRPTRSHGKHRLFSFQEVDLLLKIKALKEKGLNLAGIREVLLLSESKQNQQEESLVQKQLSDQELRRILRRELIYQERPGKTPLNYGEFTRFFRH